MFEFHLIEYRNKLWAIAIRCINCKKDTVLYLIISTFEEIITKFVLNAMLYHVGILWII